MRVLLWGYLWFGLLLVFLCCCGLYIWWLCLPVCRWIIEHVADMRCLINLIVSKALRMASVVNCLYVSGTMCVFYCGFSVFGLLGGVRYRRFRLCLSVCSRVYVPNFASEYANNSNPFYSGLATDLQAVHVSRS